MITAAVAPVDNVTNATAAWVVLALLAVFAICATLWHHERISDRQTARIDTHDEQLAELAYQMPALLDWLGIEIPAPVVDDSPDALEAEEAEFQPVVCLCDGKPGPHGYGAPGCLDEPKPDELPTDEIPIAPATVPDGMPLAVHTALIEQRPSPVPRKSADWVEQELERIRARIDAAREAS